MFCQAAVQKDVKTESLSLLAVHHLKVPLKSDKNLPHVNCRAGGSNPLDEAPSSRLVHSALPT